MTPDFAAMITCVVLGAYHGDSIHCDGVLMRMIGNGEPHVSGVHTPELGWRAGCDTERALAKTARDITLYELRRPGVLVKDGFEVARKLPGKDPK